jgi:hypothetical protein
LRDAAMPLEDRSTFMPKQWLPLDVLRDAGRSLH